MNAHGEGAVPSLACSLVFQSQSLSSVYISLVLLLASILNNFFCFSYSLTDNKHLRLKGSNALLGDEMIKNVFSPSPITRMLC